MVEFDLPAALVGGFVGTVVMTAMMAMAASARLTAMPPMPLVTGSMMSGDRRTATMLGSIVHYLVMGTVVFGIAYGAAFTGLDDDSWWVGALMGLGHGLVVGLVLMPMMPLMHPRMTSELVGAGAGAAGAASAPAPQARAGQDDVGQVDITAPGVLGRNWGAMTPAGMLTGHAVYGLVVAVVYGWIA